MRVTSNSRFNVKAPDRGAIRDAAPPVDQGAGLINTANVLDMAHALTQGATETVAAGA